VPAQPVDVDGVIVYATSIGDAVVLFNISAINAPVPVVLAGLLIPATTGLVQANVANGVELVIVYASAVLLQIESVASLVITAVGSTVTM
jgi:hypothetical protein